MYTEEQKTGLRKLFGLNEEQISLLEEAEDLAKTGAVYQHVPAYVRQYARMVESWLRQKNLWDEVVETLQMVSAGVPREKINKQKPFGICLLAALKCV